MNRTTRRGATAIEFALTLPILAMVLSAVIDYGDFFFTRSVVVQAAQDGARTAARADADEDAGAIGAAVARASLADLGIACGDGCETEGALIALGDFTAVEVTVNLPYSPIMGLAPVPNRVRAIMSLRLENEPEP